MFSISFNPLLENIGNGLTAESYHLGGSGGGHGGRGGRSRYGYYSALAYDSIYVPVLNGSGGGSGCGSGVGGGLRSRTSCGSGGRIRSGGVSGVAGGLSGGRGRRVGRGLRSWGGGGGGGGVSSRCWRRLNHGSALGHRVPRSITASVLDAVCARCHERGRLRVNDFVGCRSTACAWLPLPGLRVRA